MNYVHKPHNLSAVIRSAEAVGILEAHAVSRGQRTTRLFQGVAAGSRRWVKVHTHSRFSTPVEALEKRGFQILAAHSTPEAEDFRQVDYTRPTALMLGEELGGLSDEQVALAHRAVAIPMMGMGTSLNVSVAAALLLFEAQRQRLAAGLYDRCRLDPQTFEATLFEWAYPEIAQLCRRRGAPYPALSEDGELLEEPPRG